MVGCQEPPRPPSRNSEVSAPLAPKFNLNATRGLPRSLSGLRKTQGARSLSPALQVLQRSILAPSPDTPRLPDAPRGERPSEYIAELSKAFHRGAYHEPPTMPSGPPPSPQEELRSKAVNALLGGIDKGKLEEIFVQRIQAKANLVSGQASAGVRAALPISGAGGLLTAAPSRPATPVHVTDALQKRVNRVPHSARATRSTSEQPTGASTALHSARSSRSRPLSAAAQLWTLEEKVDVGEVWKRQMHGTLFSPAPQKDAKMAGTSALARPQPSPSNDPMDALDGLLASLEEERAMPTENHQASSPPRAKPTTDLAVTAAIDIQEAKSTTTRRRQPKTTSVEGTSGRRRSARDNRLKTTSAEDDGLPVRKCGIAPVQSSLIPPLPIAARLHTFAPRTCPPLYDEAIDASSPHLWTPPCSNLDTRHLRAAIYGYSETAVDLDESQASASVYCDMSPTIMSVHMPGSPTPRSAEAFEFDVTADPVMACPARPRKVRVECGGGGTDSNADKHVPQLPSRRHSSTGKLSSRPLGCMQRVANFGGA